MIIKRKKYFGIHNIFYKLWILDVIIKLLLVEYTVS